MHVLFALSSFYPDHRAGTETYVLNLSKELINMGYKVSVIIPAVGKASSNYTFEGISVYTFSVPLKVSTKELNGLEKPSGIDEFGQLLQQIKPGIFHLHSLGRSMHAEHLKLASEMGIKTVFTAHLPDNFCMRGDLKHFGKVDCNGQAGAHKCLSCFIHQKKSVPPVFSKTLALLIRLLVLKTHFSFFLPAFSIIQNKLKQLKIISVYSQKNIALGNWLEQIYSLNGIGNTTVIRPGVDAGFIAEESFNPHHEKKIRLLFIGRMHPLKNLEIIFQSLLQLKEHFDLWIITIPFSQEMDYYHKIKKIYDESGFTNWFENLDSMQVAENLKEVDLLVLPSRYEAAPLVILEAFAKKIPVIGSDFIAIKEMVQHNVNGLLFKNGDAESLKGQLLRLLREPELLHKLKQNIGQVRSFKEVAREHDQIYRSI